MIPSERRYGKGHIFRAACLLAAAVWMHACAPAGDGAPVTSLEDADSRLAIAERLIQGGIYDRAQELAAAVLGSPHGLTADESPEETRAWLARREFARFLYTRGELGQASSLDDYLAAAASFLQLSHNRYRLPDPAYAMQAAYWAGRAFESAGEYADAAAAYDRVGGVTLPPEMEGDAALRHSRCLRMLAEDIPYPGSHSEKLRRDKLLDEALTELDRARLAFPVGSRRKEIELDLIALRMARREDKFVREAVTEADAFIDSDPTRDVLHARAMVYRGQAAAILGDPGDAVKWFRRVLEEEAPDDDDRRAAERGLALSLIELSETAGDEHKARLLRQAEQALENAAAGAMSPGPWDGARILRARMLLQLQEPAAASAALAPILDSGPFNAGAWYAAGLAELQKGRLENALARFAAVSRPSTGSRELRYAACREGSRTAAARREYGLALALNHQASRILRENRLFAALLTSEFTAMEIILRLGRMAGPVSLSGDYDLLTADPEAHVVSAEQKREDSARDLAGALGRFLTGGGSPDTAYDLAVETEAAFEWSGPGKPRLELAIGMLSHLTTRRPAGVADGVIASRLGEARHALALAWAQDILEADAPNLEHIDLALADFSAAAASFQRAAAGGFSLQDSLDQGMVSMESGAFLMQLADKWNRGEWYAPSLRWREEARQRIESSIRPFSTAVASTAPSSVPARRARWARGRALELMGDWRGASADFHALMNNSELPRVLRANAARRWAVCMAELGQNRQALARLSVFADSDAESALLAGRLAESAGYLREAYQRYLFAADPASPALPPATPGRVQEAAFSAAGIAIADPREAEPLMPAETVAAHARELLEKSARLDPHAAKTPDIVRLLGESWMREPDGWRKVHALALETLAEKYGSTALDRTLYILAATASAAGGSYARALDELDEARELLDDTPAARPDAARIMLQTARVYRLQGRHGDAMRAYTDVFAVYPDAEDSAGAARAEAAVMLLSSPDSGPREHERARNILSGLPDQVLAERILREYAAR